MSSLPQRKKSPEEINKLRESLGVPVSPDPIEDAERKIDTLAPTHHAAEVAHKPHPSSEFAAPLPAPSTFAPHESHSLKRSEHPQRTSDDASPAVSTAKPVKSLRRSEREPLTSKTPTSGPATSKLPTHRHSDQELGEMRRREMLAMAGGPGTTADPRFSSAHLGIVIPGYLLAALVWLPLADTLYLSLSAGAGWSFLGQPAYHIAIPAAAAAIALLIASFVFLKKPISRHHAAFITAITVFALVFEALHYFPQLRHAT